MNSSKKGGEPTGFTLIEVLLTVGIIGIIGAVGVSTFIGYKKTQDLDSASKALVSYLRDAHQRATSQDQSAKWGVHLDAPSGERNFYEIFYGDDYSSGIKTEKIYLPNSVAFADPVPGSSKDIIFSKLTGFSQGGSKTVVISSASDPSSYKTINISSVGLIEL